MSLDSRLREASSELEAVTADTAIPVLSQRTKSRPLTGLLICVAVVTAVAFPLLFSDSNDTGQCRPNEPCAFEPMAPGAVSPTPESETADAILEFINELREDNDLSPLAANDDLQAYANLHSEAMASTGILAHSDISDLLGPFTMVGENIGYGPTWPSIFSADLVAIHYVEVPIVTSGVVVTRGMIESRFTDAGVGVYLDPDGTLWVTVVFATRSLP
jgi:uncharacterized protein YkwD